MTNSNYFTIPQMNNWKSKIRERKAKANCENQREKQEYNSLPSH